MAGDFLFYAIALGKSALLVIATLLPIINPPSTATIFLSLTEGASVETRRELSNRIARNVFLLMLACTLVGSFVLEFFGISLEIVRVAGGLLVVNIGWRLLGAENTESARAARLAEAYTPEMVRKTHFYPLSFPITCGPGTVAATITVGASLADPALATAAARTTGAVLGLAVVAFTVLMCYRYAQSILRPLGETGTLVFMRLSAFILLCLGIQILWDGLAPLMTSVVRQGLALGA